MIITVGRQLGSGGLAVGRILAERLGYDFYDKELLIEAARQSGICPECFKQVDEQARHSFGGVGFFGMRFPFIGDADSLNTISSDNLFLMQSETILKLADSSVNGAVFVGRCADYVLRNRKDLLSVFVSADCDDRIKRIIDRKHCSEDEARDMMKRIDKQRSAYYDYYASREWGVAKNYDLCINSSLLGIERTADAVIEVVRMFQSK